MKGNFYPSKPGPFLKLPNMAWLLGMAQRAPLCSPSSSGAYTPPPTRSRLPTREADGSSNILQRHTDILREMRGCCGSEGWHYSVQQKKLRMETEVISVKSAHGKNVFPPSSWHHRPPRQPLLPTASSGTGSVNTPLALQPLQLQPWPLA